MAPDSVVFCNGDDDYLRAMTCPQKKITFGLSEGCTVRAEEIEYLGTGGVNCVIVSGDRRIPVSLSYGDVMLYAALEGAAVGLHYGLTDAEIAAGIAAYRPEGARASVEQASGFTIVNDCYNANPDSMAAGLRALQRADALRRVAILGDMGELGPTAERLHFETGVTAGKCGVDLLITCGPLSKHMAAGAKEAGVKRVLSFDTLSETIAALPDAIGPGDRVLVKASHSMQFEKIVSALHTLYRENA